MSKKDSINKKSEKEATRSGSRIDLTPVILSLEDDKLYSPGQLVTVIIKNGLFEKLVGPVTPYSRRKVRGALYNYVHSRPLVDIVDGLVQTDQGRFVVGRLGIRWKQGLAHGRRGPGVRLNLEHIPIGYGDGCTRALRPIQLNRKSEYRFSKEKEQTHV